MSALFVNGKPTVINGLRKLRNPPSWLVMFLVVSFNKMLLFCKNLVTCIISFISLFARVIPEPMFFYLFSNNIKSCIYIKIILFILIFLVSILFNLFEYESSTLNGKLTELSKPVISVKNPPDYIILDNWVFENFILADEPFAEILQIFETFVLANDKLYGKLVSPLEFPIKFTSVPCLIPDSNVLNCELDNFTFIVSY